MSFTAPCQSSWLIEWFASATCAQSKHIDYNTCTFIRESTNLKAVLSAIQIRNECGTLETLGQLLGNGLDRAVDAPPLCGVGETTSVNVAHAQPSVARLTHTYLLNHNKAVLRTRTQHTSQLNAICALKSHIAGSGSQHSGSQYVE